jgi:signal transduction histidine kinase
MQTGSGGLLRSNVATALLSALVLLFIAVGSSYLSARTDSLARKAFAAGDVGRRMSDVYAQLVGAESGQRGYLITLDDKYLGPFRAAKTDIRSAIEELRERADDLGSDARLPNLDDFSQLVDRKFAEMQKTVDLARSGDSAAANDMVRADMGRLLMDQASDFRARFRSATERFRMDRLSQMSASASLLAILTTLGVVAVLILSLLAIMQVRRYTREIDVARATLASVNTELEDRVTARTRDLLRANEELQRYAYIVSHDLRAPLVNIMGFTAELEQATDKIRTAMAAPDIDRKADRWAPAVEAVEQDVPEALGFIKSSMNRMDALIGEILKLSRLGRLTLVPEQIDMAELVQDCFANLQHRLDTQGAQALVEQPLPDVIGDRNSLQQIFANLLDNAVKYFSSERQGRVAVRGRISKGMAIFEIEDNGRGIAPKDQERIYDLFRRAGSQDRPGDGIGLAHVRSLVRRMGGEISVTSDGGTGSTFRLSLPHDLRPHVVRKDNA